MLAQIFIVFDDICIKLKYVLQAVIIICCHNIINIFSLNSLTFHCSIKVLIMLKKSVNYITQK